MTQATTQDAPLMLSVSGMRGIVGASLTPHTALRFANALVDVLGPGSYLIGRDSRTSGPWLTAAVSAALMARGCGVTDLGVVSTPCVAVRVRQVGAAGALVATASHNPQPWNGLKPIGPDAAALSPDRARQLIERFHADTPPRWAPWQGVGTLQRDGRAVQEHVRAVLERVDVQRIRARRLKVVLESVCGAGGEEGLMLLRELGCEALALHAEPTGLFPHPPEPLKENLTELCEQVVRHGADVGFAQDPDADRLALVDEAGRYIGEEYTLTLAADQVLARHGERGAVLVTNLSGSRMVDDVAARHGAQVVRTPVGEAHVAAAMRAHGALVGGEGNGGVIDPSLSFVRDSLAGMAIVLERLATQRLGAWTDSLPRYVMVKRKLPAEAGVMQRLTRTLRDRYPDAEVDERDGLRVALRDRWLHVRPSNTEPIVRVIAEAPDEASVAALVSGLSGVG